MKTFLDHYLNYAAVNESPYLYHKWCGLSLISHLVGRRIWTDEGMFVVKPNMYVNLVGPPGLAKTTALNVAKNFIETNYPNIFMAPASITKESIVQTMARDDGGCHISFDYNGSPIKFSQLSIFANEMVSLLSAGGNVLGMVDFMTDVWDRNEYREKTKNKGDNTIKNPFVNIIGCFTTDTVQHLMHSKMITGGMSRRCIFAFADGSGGKPVPRITYTDAQKESMQVCVQMAKEFTKCIGPFMWTEAANEFYNEWYNENFYRIEATQSHALKNFLRSKAEYCIKVSMLLAMAEPGPQRVHTLNSFREATELVTEVESGASLLFDSSGRNELATVATEVESYIRRAKSIEISDLRRDFWKEAKDGDLTEIDRILSHLAMQGKVAVIEKIEGSTPVKRVKWVGTGSS